MLETVLSILSSGAAGGILGTVGNVIKGREARKLKELDHKHELAMESLTQESMKLEAELKVKEIDLQNQGKAKLANIEATRAIEMAETELLEASYKHDKAQYGGSFVDTVRGLTRPLLTLGSLGFLVYIFVALTRIMGGLDNADPVFLQEVYERVIIAAVFISTTAMTWWFGSRPTKGN